jgi:hypothetical protein
VAQPLLLFFILFYFVFTAKQSSTLYVSFCKIKKMRTSIIRNKKINHNYYLGCGLRVPAALAASPHLRV